MKNIIQNTNIPDNSDIQQDIYISESLVIGGYCIILLTIILIFIATIKYINKIKPFCCDDLIRIKEKLELIEKDLNDARQHRS